MFLELPAEIASNVVGKWLHQRDIVRLDSAFCNSQQRPVFLESVLQSPYFCMKDVVTDRKFVPRSAILWLVARRVRVEVVRFSKHCDHTVWEPYLKEHGKYIKYARFERIRPENPCRSDMEALLALYCPNISALAWVEADLARSFAELCGTFSNLESVDIVCFRNSDRFNPGDVPVTHHLHLKSISMLCPGHLEEMVFKACAPASIQKLRLNHIHAPNWSEFVNLRSLGFQHCYAEGFERHMLNIFKCCPLIANLDVSKIQILSEVFAFRMARALSQLRTLNMNFVGRVRDFALREIAIHHKHTLEALFVKSCTEPTESGIHFILRECTHLHTLCCDSLYVSSYSSMTNIQSLKINWPCCAQSWEEMRRHCNVLRHLEVTFPRDHRTVPEVVREFLTTAQELRSLRTLALLNAPDAEYNEIHHVLSLSRPNLQLSRCECATERYDLFKLDV